LSGCGASGESEYYTAKAWRTFAMHRAAMDYDGLKVGGAPGPGPDAGLANK
jgi:hypothetical protein